MNRTTPSIVDGALTRRRWLQGVAATVGVSIGGGFVPGVPMIWAQNIKHVTLRQFGTAVSNINEIARKAKEDLGITLTMTALDSDAVVQRSVTQPKSYDIADIEYWMAKKVVPTGVLQPLDTQKIKFFDKIVPVFITGRLTAESKVAQGTALHTVEFVTRQDSAQFAAEPTRYATLIPTIYNADTLGIRPDLIKRPIASWAELLNPEFKGKASILNIPSIGIMDAAMVCESVGAITYTDKGNMTKDEIDKTLKVLTDAKKAGQFRAFWKTFDESVNLMAAGEVVIQSMWSPAVTAVRAKGIPCYYTPLKEGYRAWAGGLGLAKHLSGLELDASYEYFNWYLSGWVGAFLNRQGYYSAVLETAKQHMSEDEWGYWMEGKPAQGAIVDPFGIKIESAGAVRDGGSFYERMGRVTCWNSVMDENRHMIQRWNEFIAPFTIVLAAFLIFPLLAIIVVSFWDYTEYTIVPAFVLTNYRDILSSHVTYTTYLNTLKFAFLTWFFTLTIGFTIAYFLAFHVRTLIWQIALFLLCTVPFLTSNIIRMISWIPFLGRHGIFNATLQALGLIHGPLEFLLFSDFAVVLTFVHLYTLFLVIPIFNSMMRIDRTLLAAAADCGASAGQVVREVIMPLSKPGMTSGSIFMVTLVMGDFVTERLMSGGQSASVGLMMMNQIALLQYPAAAANAVILLTVTLLIVAAMVRIVDIRKEL